MKQVQDAYIVAATRTPIGRSHRGFFRNTRPDDLLVTVLQVRAGAGARRWTARPSRTSICGCAIPEGQQGLNVARIGAVLAGLPNSVGGITVNRFCASGLSAMQMAADRIRVGEADVMIAAGVESMSMVPMMGNTPSLRPPSSPTTRREHRHRLRHGPDRREGGAAVEGQRARRRTRSRCNRTEGARPRAGRRVHGRDRRRSRWSSARPTWRPAKSSPRRAP